MAARYRYDPYGNLLGLAEANPYRFSSKEIHAASGLYTYGFRCYAPTLQRWLTRDPLGEAGCVNRYGFVGNDSLGSVDPHGLLWDTLWDLGKVLFDAGKAAYGYFTGDDCLVKEGLSDLALDGAALAVPFVPAGTKKLTRVARGVGRYVDDALSGADDAAELAGKNADLVCDAAKTAETLPADIAATFRGGNYSSHVLQSDVVAYPFSGGVSEPAGRFLTTQQTVRWIGTPDEAIRALNLPPGATAQ